MLKIDDNLTFGWIIFGFGFKVNFVQRFGPSDLGAWDLGIGNWNGLGWARARVGSETWPSSNFCQEIPHREPRRAANGWELAKV